MQYREPVMVAGAEGRVDTTIDKPKLVVIDDSLDWGNFVSEVAEKSGFSARSTTVPSDFAEICRTESADVLVLDLFMPEKDGIEMILDMEHVEERPFIILISGQSRTFLDSAVTLGKGKGLEIVGALPKPFRLPELRAMLQKAADLVEKKRRMRSEADKNGPGEMPVSSAKNTDFRRSRVSGENNSRIAAAGGNIDSSISVKASIAQTNAQFCIMLWDNQLTTLDALSTVPSELAEAAAGVIASDADTADFRGWHQSLRMHLQNIMGERTAVRDIAGSQQFAALGMGAVQSIERINAIVSEILDEKGKEEESQSQILANFRELCSENEKVKEHIAALRNAVRKSLAQVRDTSGLSGSFKMSADDERKIGNVVTIRPGK